MSPTNPDAHSGASRSSKAPAHQETDLLKRPLYVYDLPPELLSTLEPKDGPQPDTTEPPHSPLASPSTSPSPAATPINDSQKASASCTLCGAAFSSSGEQRAHAKTDWHAYNLKQRMRGGKPVDEIQFEKLVGELNESISGSDSSDDESEGDGDASLLASLLKRQAKTNDSVVDGDEEAQFFKTKRKRGTGKPPLIWFSSSLLPSNTSLGIYRALLTPEQQASPDTVGIIRDKQLAPLGKQNMSKDDGNGVPLPADVPGPSVFICMIGGGHFAAMIVSLTPELVKNHHSSPERRAKTIAQKTFHRYTTRRKQGGAQSANDAAKGNAHSAGAGIRRANEAALTQEVRKLLWEWRGMIANCELLFVRASGTTNRRLLFEKHEQQVLFADDQRLRSVPFSTRRATQMECMRTFLELTRVKVSQVDEAALAAAQAERQKEEQRIKDRAAAASAPKVQEPPAMSPEEEEALVHTAQIQALIRRNKVPGLLSYLSKNDISANFRFHPETSQANHHATTPLHLAASMNSPVMINALLIKADADPALPNGEGRAAFDLAGDRATRDAFRVARSELGEGKWAWTKAHVPPAITRAESEQRDQDDKAQNAKDEAQRRKDDLDRLERERSKTEGAKRPPGKALGGVEITAADKREQEARGLTPEMRTRLERERRARAAEERMKRLAGR